MSAERKHEDWQPMTSGPVYIGSPGNSVWLDPDNTLVVFAGARQYTFVLPPGVRIYRQTTATLPWEVAASKAQVSAGAQGE